MRQETQGRVAYQYMLAARICGVRTDEKQLESTMQIPVFAMNW